MATVMRAESGERRAESEAGALHFLTGITINWPGINQKFIFSFNSN